MVSPEKQQVYSSLSGAYRPSSDLAPGTDAFYSARPARPGATPTVTMYSEGILLSHAGISHCFAVSLRAVCARRIASLCSLHGLRYLGRSNCARPPFRWGTHLDRPARRTGTAVAKTKSQSRCGCFPLLGPFINVRCLLMSKVNMMMVASKCLYTLFLRRCARV
jgi:hypothetical protein